MDYQPFVNSQSNFWMPGNTSAQPVGHEYPETSSNHPQTPYPSNTYSYSAPAASVLQHDTSSQWPHQIAAPSFQMFAPEVTAEYTAGAVSSTRQREGTDHWTAMRPLPPPSLVSSPPPSIASRLRQLVESTVPTYDMLSRAPIQRPCTSNLSSQSISGGSQASGSTHPSVPLSLTAPSMPQQAPAVLNTAMEEQIRASSVRMWDFLCEVNAKAVSISFFQKYSRANLEVIWGLMRNEYETARNQMNAAVTVMPLHQFRSPTEEEIC